MTPKTEKELELYFMLEELSILKKKKNENYVYMDAHYKQLYLDKFNILKDQYLKLANE